MSIVRSRILVASLMTDISAVTWPDPRTGSDNTKIRHVKIRFRSSLAAHIPAGTGLGLREKKLSFKLGVSATKELIIFTCSGRFALGPSVGETFRSHPQILYREQKPKTGAARLAGGQCRRENSKRNKLYLTLSSWNIS